MLQDSITFDIHSSPDMSVAQFWFAQHIQWLHCVQSIKIFNWMNEFLIASHETERWNFWWQLSHREANYNSLDYECAHVTNNCRSHHNTQPWRDLTCQSHRSKQVLLTKLVQWLERQNQSKIVLVSLTFREFSLLGLTLFQFLI